MNSRFLGHRKLAAVTAAALLAAGAGCVLVEQLDRRVELELLFLLLCAP